MATGFGVGVHSPRKWARGQNCGIEKWLLEISEERWAVNLSWVFIFPTQEHHCFLSSFTLAIAFSPLALNLTTLTPVSKSQTLSEQMPEEQCNHAFLTTLSTQIVDFCDSSTTSDR